MAVRTWTAIGLLLGALGWAAGCQIDGKNALREAAGGFEPIGPIRLVQAMPDAPSDPEPSASDDTSRMPDSRVRLVVGRKLERAELPIEELTIEVDGQVVVLRGTVSGLVDRDRAELIARSVEGVRDVRNRIEVTSEQ